MHNRARWSVSLICAAVTIGLLSSPAMAAGHSQRHMAMRHRAIRHREAGLASVYSPKLAGKKAANGKPFKPSKLTAASRDLPLDSKAKVTNLKTGKSTDVTVTDRGPHKKGRVIDLSPAAAQKIGVSKKEGVAPVAVEPVSQPSDSAP